MSSPCCRNPVRGIIFYWLLPEANEKLDIKFCPHFNIFIELVLVTDSRFQNVVIVPGIRVDIREDALFHKVIDGFDIRVSSQYFIENGYQLCTSHFLIRTESPVFVSRDKAERIGFINSALCPVAMNVGERSSFAFC